MSDDPRVLPEDISITRIPIEYVDGVWPEVSIVLKKGVDASRGRYDMNAVYEDIMKESQHLWVIFRGDNEILASFTTQFCYYPLKMNLSVVFCGSNESMGGVSGNWIRAMELLKEWAKVFGCDAIEIVGRRGWLKVFKSIGFEESYITVESKV